MSASLPEPSALLASLLKQMTRFSCLGNPGQAALIRRELALLGHYPDETIPPLLKQVGLRLEKEWAQLQFAVSDDPNPQPHCAPRLH